MSDMQTVGAPDSLRNWTSGFIGIDPGPPKGVAPQPAKDDPAKKMDADWTAAVKAGDWKTAAVVVNGFSPDDLQKRLKPLQPDQRAKLHQGALDGGIGPDSAVGKATQPGQAAPEGGAAPENNLKVEGEVPAECEGKCFGGKAKIKWKAKISFKAIVGEGKSDTSLVIDGKKALAAKAVTEWWKSTATHGLAGLDIIDEQKLETEGAINTKDGVSVKAVYTVGTPLGSLTVSGTLFKWKPGSKVEAGILEGACVTKDLKLPPVTIDGVPIHDIAISAEIGFEIEPQYLKIIADAVFDRLKSTVIQGAKDVAADVAVDIAVDASLILVAVGVVAGVAVVVSESVDQRALIGMVGGAQNMFITGLNAALEGRADPGGDWQSYGWRAGDKVVSEAMAKARQQHPDLDDFNLRPAVVNKTRRLVDDPAIKTMMHEKTGKQFWSAWIATHQGYTTTTGNAQDACAACFGGVPMDYNDSHPHMQEWVKVSKYLLKNL